MAEDIGYSGAKVYTDIQGLENVRHSQNKEATKKEVAQQFESIMMQMVLKSMRDATTAMSSGLFSNNAMELYQDMFDKQLSLLMSNANIGFAKMVENSIDQMTNPQSAVANTAVPIKVQHSEKSPTIMAAPKIMNKADATASNEPSRFSSPEEFIKKLWSTAKVAAKYIGTSPDILLAQAALETNWGKNILKGQGGSSFNLFNIKAGPEWKNQTTALNTIEQKNGVLVKEQAKFKNYHSYTESFMDYVDLLKGSDRYRDVLNKAPDPQQFIKALHAAGYATDQHYSDKVLSIFSSQTFKNLIDKVKNI